MFCGLRWRFTVVTFFIDSNLVYYDVMYPYMNISAIFWSVVIGGYDLITHLFASLISVRHQKDSFIVLLISLFSEAFHHHYNKKNLVTQNIVFVDIVTFMYLNIACQITTLDLFHIWQVYALQSPGRPPKYFNEVVPSIFICILYLFVSCSMIK